LTTSAGSEPQALGDRLADLGRRLDLRRDEVLFHQGDRASSVFWVSRGRLRLDRHLASGRVVTLSVARAPATIAEASLFSSRYHCRAVAEVLSSVTVVPKARVLDLLEEDATFALSLVRALATEVRALRRLLELRNVRPASARLLDYLALRQDRGEPTADRPLAALASELGLTPEALYRILARLERQGVIRRHGREIALTGPEKSQGES
jgi:CRP-like cAMP-binding protein